MLLIQAEKISFQYESSAEPAFENITCAIYDADKIGLIGINGCGKTTLIKVFAGSLKPGSGTVQKKNSINIGYLAQENITENYDTAIEFLLSANPEALRVFRIIKEAPDADEKAQHFISYAQADGFELESKIEQIREKFNFNEDFYDKNPHLFSGGEKVKLALMRILLCNPDVIFLDEPTNHLDAAAIEWLGTFISEIDVAVVIISHDRAFLDSTVSVIWEMTEPGIRKFGGNYSNYKSLIEKEQEHARKIYAETKRHIKKLKKAAAAKRMHAEKNEHFKPGRSVKKNGGLCQIDVGRMQLVREQSIMKGAVAIENRLEKETANLSAINLKKEKNLKLLLHEGNIRNKFILVLDNISKAFDDLKVLTGFFLSIRPSEKIAVMGKNGSGKSTLLKICAGKIAADNGTVTLAPQSKVSYFAQEYEELDYNIPIIDYLCNNSKELEIKARTILGCLNITGDMVFKQISKLSAGQKSKVALTKMLIGNFDLLLLDEPMSHLEISSREAFEQALQNFSGAVICVTHDRYFAERFADRVVQFEH